VQFTIAAGPRLRILRSESRGTRDHILLSQIRHSLNLEDQVPVFISPRNRVAQFYPQALGSLSVAPYDSQSYTGSNSSCVRSSLYSLGAASAENTASSIVLKACLQRRCIAIDVLLLRAHVLRECVYRPVA
jgi:hypothetical protein